MFTLPRLGYNRLPGGYFKLHALFGMIPMRFADKKIRVG